ncbi:MAG: F0F1 ATP synthase subunit A [Solirubrobacteraceae bacterium MAG38_C4-C5]|nr:F0F1 ATP synthase subunit A [Candidatus Siliceabacter maunaloa]
MKTLKNLPTLAKVGLGFAALLIPTILLGIIVPSAGEGDFQPQEEFRLEPYVTLELGPVDLSPTKAVLYLLLASAITLGLMLYIANRMQARPNRTQTAVETAYTFMRDNIARGNMDDAMARRWFPFVATLFLFIWVSNMIGYIPLPLNTAHPIEVGGLKLPTFAIYAATANISVPLVLTLMVVIAYHVEGVRAKGPVKYVKGWVPAGVSGFAAFPIFIIEVISQFVRIISLSVRLFANMLAGHLLILFMGGGLAVILGLAALGYFTLPIAWVFFLFEIVLIATLQAFIFATLTAIYLGEAVAESH